MTPENLSYVPKHSFNSEELAVLEEAFRSAWATIGHKSPGPVAESKEDLKARLGTVLFALASQGVKDPHTLRNLALRYSPLRDILLTREAARTSQ